MGEEKVKQRYFVELAYKGTNFHGWQIQPNAISVQEVLNKALSTVLREPIETVGCGRTDTGVHATNFLAHFDTLIEIVTDNTIKSNGVISEDRLVKATNALVGFEIAIKRFVKVDNEAHARFDAISRSYEYHVSFEKDPFKRDFSHHITNKPAIKAMNEAAKIIMTYTDFSCFSKSNTQTFTNNCKITRAEWVEVKDGLVFHISADRFLRNMVRAIVGTLLDVGKGTITVEDVRKVIESKNRSNAGESVPASGLFLTDIIYPEHIFKTN